MGKQKSKNGISVQALLGIKGFGEYGIVTGSGETLLYAVKPTNISVLSAANIELKIHQLMMVLSALPSVEILCTDDSECFEDNKAYLAERIGRERNTKIKTLLAKDKAFLDGIQNELSSARQFLFVVQCKGMKTGQVFTMMNQVQKLIAEQGFDVHRLAKSEIKRFLALYFEASLYGEYIPDTDGEQYYKEEK